MAEHATHHHGDAHAHHATGEIKSKTAFVSSFWFVLILVGLFIAALNFIEVMGHESEGHGNKEATSTQTLKEESGLGREAEGTSHENAASMGHDSVSHEAQPAEAQPAEAHH